VTLDGSENRETEREMEKADIGLVGLAVMGRNLVLNMEDHGFRVAVYNRTWARTEEFMTGEARGRRIAPCRTLEDLVTALARPRKVMFMVRAGAVVDDLIERIAPLLDAGDVIIDGGNSLFTDTERRVQTLAAQGILYIGTGISGGEEGARHGPSIMPGGHAEAWPLVRPILQAIAARVEGRPCCDWVGEGGAGHFVKMVHNGIEYGDMQLIGEAYDLMGRGLGLDQDRMAAVFEEWNRGRLSSYLVEITSHILRKKDEDGTPLLGKIMDRAGQKGTGRWTVAGALEENVPLTLIGEAVFSRFLSAMKEERVRAASLLAGPGSDSRDRSGLDLEDLEAALYGAKIVSYAQGYLLMRAASQRYGWRLRYGEIALMWRGGCIIRSAFLGDIAQAFSEDPNLDNLLLAPFFRHALADCQVGWRRSVSWAVTRGLAVPALAAGLTFYDGLRSDRLPANLLQAQRDYFGAHTYERLDREPGQYFHTDWTAGD